jgi:hypothetical protein
MLNQAENMLAYSTSQKLEVWREHYQNLFDDVTEHSGDMAYWREELPGEPNELIENINDDFTWMELNNVLHRMKGGKSPGCDGIPPEFFKLARTKRDEVIPSAPLGCYLLTLSNASNPSSVLSPVGDGTATAMPGQLGLRRDLC